MRIGTYRYILARRTVQASLLFLLFAGNALGWTLWTGNLSFSRIAERIPLADSFAVLQTLSAGIVVAAETLIGALITLVFFGIVGGRAFCSWVCPVNMVTDLAAWLRRFLHMDASGEQLKMSRTIRYWALGMSLALSLLTGVAAFEWISPISMLHRGVVFGMGLGWVVILCLFLFDLLAVRYGFCGHICPLGGFYSLVGHFSMVRVAHKEEKCSLCMACIKICPEEQVLQGIGKRSGWVHSGECTNCGRCVEVCEDHAMMFGIRFLYEVIKGGNK